MALIRQLILGFALLFAPFAYAESHDAFWPGANYDPAVPTFNQVLGYGPGEEITTHKDMVRYFEALEAAKPEHVKIFTYGETWQGRRLIYVVIGAPDRMADLNTVQDGMKRLADPRVTNRAAADGLIDTLPAITWLAYSVHGNEISSTDAAMLTAYHLLAARGDARVADILGKTLVILNPLQNPDGRDRFIHQFETARGLVPDSDLISAEHNEPWPGGRSNHYLFDMNRDWFILSQPETQGHVAALQQWYPTVFVDLHEMGSNSTYYFAPEAVPYNPHLAEDQRASLTLFGKNNAKWFDEFGIDYFTREVYDAFYPGYGASWPSYYGSIAMTYEQASVRGLIVRKDTGDEFPYWKSVRNHFVTSLSTAETTARNREKFLRDFYNYRVSAIEEGRKENVRSFLIPVQDDQAGADKLAGLLVKQGVEVSRVEEEIRACDTILAPGSYVISTAQPAKRLIRTLLDKDVPLEKDFLTEQERRRAKALGDEIYDVTAWSLPLMFNIDVQACNRVPTGRFTPAEATLIPTGKLVNPNAQVAYLVPWGDAAAGRLLSAALRSGLQVKSSDAAFTHGGTHYPAGTLIFDKADNPADLGARLAALAVTSGADIYGIDDSWVTQGPNFGSERVVRLLPPKIAIAWDEPTSSLSAGNTRFVLERQFNYPVTAIRVDDLKRADLRRYDVLILPEQWGDYGAVLGKGGTENLKDWVRRGGVLIGIGSAMQYLSDPDHDFLSTRREERAGVKKDENGAEEATVPGTLLTSRDEYRATIEQGRKSLDSVAGILARADVDPDHWMAAGVAGELQVLVSGRDIYTPLTLDEGVNVARFKGPDELLTSGYMWEENRKQLAFKPFAVAAPMGRGQVIGFTQSPTTRAYLDGLNVIFLNAIFRGAAHASPVR